MTNLSDLFPAGAGKQVSFTANGNVTGAGKAIILNSDGTISQVAETAQSETMGTKAVFDSTISKDIGITYDTGQNKVFVAYVDSGDGSKAKGCVGTISGNSISWGTPVVLDSYSCAYASCSYDTANEKVVAVWRSTGGGAAIDGYGNVITISGTSFSLGTGSRLFRYGLMNYLKITYDIANNCHLVSMQNGAVGNYGYSQKINVVGTTFTVQSGQTSFESTTTQLFDQVYDPDQEKHVLLYHDSSDNVKTIVADCSGAVTDNPTFGSSLTLNASATGNAGALSYDSGEDKVGIFYNISNSAGSIYGRVGTVSGTSITAGTAVNFTNGQSTSDYTFGADYNASTQTNVLAYGDDYNNRGAVRVATISGTTLTWAASQVVYPLIFSETRYNAIVYDPDSTHMAIGFAVDSDEGTGVVYQQAATLTNLTAAKFLGVSDAAISSAASGNVTIKGGIAATGLSSLTPGSDYYAQGDGSISTTSTSPAVKIGKALSATAINLEYTS